MKKIKTRQLQLNDRLYIESTHWLTKEIELAIYEVKTAIDGYAVADMVGNTGSRRFSRECFMHNNELCAVAKTKSGNKEQVIAVLENDRLLEITKRLENVQTILTLAQSKILLARMSNKEVQQIAEMLKSHGK